MTLPKIISFKSQKEFEQINLLGKKIACKYFILILEKPQLEIQVANVEIQNGTGVIYLGLKISKKVGNAVVRNKTRRRIKHIVREFIKLEAGKAFVGSKLLIIPRHSMLSSKYADLLQEFTNSLTKSNKQNILD